MARRNKASFQKRAREKKKAEKAALKREQRSQRERETPGSEPQVATPDDLADYGLEPRSDESE
jgi:hypothetical protein